MVVLALLGPRQSEYRTEKDSDWGERKKERKTCKERKREGKDSQTKGEGVDMAPEVGEEEASSRLKAAPASPPSSSSVPPPPPPADAERVTPCGGVLKSVLRKGAEGAERPPLHSRCLGKEERAVFFFFLFFRRSFSRPSPLFSLNATPTPLAPRLKTLNNAHNTNSSLRGIPQKLGGDLHQVRRRREGLGRACGGRRRAR